VTRACAYSTPIRRDGNETFESTFDRCARPRAASIHRGRCRGRRAGRRVGRLPLDEGPIGGRDRGA